MNLSLLVQRWRDQRYWSNQCADELEDALAEQAQPVTDDYAEEVIAWTRKCHDDVVTEARDFLVRALKAEAALAQQAQPRCGNCGMDESVHDGRCPVNPRNVYTPWPDASR